MNRVNRYALLPVVGAVGFVASPAAAQSASISVPAQPLATALEQLARQGRAQIISRPALMRGKSSKLVQGTFTIESALRRMLDGTGLSYRRSGAGFLIIAGQQPVAVALPVYAQEASQGGGREPVTGGLEEIVVTARKREESLQQTPVSIVALGEAALESRSLTNTRALQNFVPNITFAGSQNAGEASANIYIRGIGQEDFLAGAEGGVGLYVDGVYLSRSAGNIMNLLDVERIEVLRGPQGTLYGKNTIGGAINVITKRPENKQAFQFSANYGSYHRLELKGSANVPLSDTVFARVSVSSTSSEGYMRRLPAPNLQASVFATGKKNGDERQGGGKTIAGRLQLRILASDKLTIDLSAEATRVRNEASATHLDSINLSGQQVASLNKVIISGALPGPPLSTSLVTSDLLTTFAGNQNFTNIDSKGGYARLTWAPDAGELQVTASYRHQTTDFGSDLDGSWYKSLQARYADTSKQGTLELQWNGKAFSDRLNYTIGAFGLHESIYSADFVDGSYVQQFNQTLFECGCVSPTPAVGPARLTELDQKSYAAYGQGSFDITDALSVTLGARYSYERKDIAGSAFGVDNQLKVGAVQSRGGNKDSWSSFTYRAGLEYEWTDVLMTYASVARGYKSGGFNSRLNASLPNLGLSSFAPETATTYELGLRSEWFNRRLRFNVTGFYTNYNDIQLRSQLVLGQSVATVISNAAKGRIQGVEVELTARPLDGLNVSVNYGHLDAKFLDVGTAVGVTTASKFQRAPSDTLAIDGSYTASVGRGEVVLSANYAYRSKEQLYLTPSPFDQPGYGIVGGRVQYNAPENWSLAVYGTNLADKRYRTGGRELLSTVGYAWSGIGRPREFGVEMKARF